MRFSSKKRGKPGRVCPAEVFRELETGLDFSPGRLLESKAFTHEFKDIFPDCNAFSGELSVHSVNGNIDISESPGIRIAELVNGNIECVINALEDDLELAVVNGSITLNLSTDAEVEIETISGVIEIAEIFNAYITDDIVGSSSEFGDGEFSIEISTVSGNIIIDN